MNKPLRILLVDDEALALEHLRRKLEETGQVDVVGMCDDGHEALTLAKKRKPDVVFIDIRMPGMDGLELAEHLACLDRQSEIVFVTAYEEYAVEAFRLNAIDYVLKPLHTNRLQLTLDRLRKRVQHSVRTETPAIDPPAEWTVHCFRRLRFKKTGLRSIRSRGERRKPRRCSLIWYTTATNGCTRIR